MAYILTNYVVQGIFIAPLILYCSRFFIFFTDLRINALSSNGTFWHPPRGRGSVEPGLLAGDAICSPTSSWWALETPMTKSRQGPASGLAGSVAGGKAGNRGASRALRPRSLMS